MSALQETKESLSTSPLRLAMPAGVSLSQDSEWCVVNTGKGWREIRFHDYAEIYSIQGLYEALFYEHLRCSSPQVVADALIAAAHQDGLRPADMRILDVGAGNGLVGQELRQRGVLQIVGIDILPEAKEAAYRDRKGIYEDYHVADLTADSTALAQLTSDRFSALTCVAALGFGDIPKKAFLRAFSLLNPRGLIGFNIKEDFLGTLDETGFGRLIRKMITDQQIEVVNQRRYKHRLGVDGEPLYYIVVVARKITDIVDMPEQDS